METSPSSWSKQVSWKNKNRISTFATKIIFNFQIGKPYLRHFEPQHLAGGDVDPVDGVAHLRHVVLPGVGIAEEVVVAVLDLHRPQVLQARAVVLELHVLDPNTDVGEDGGETGSRLAVARGQVVPDLQDLLLGTRRLQQGAVGPSEDEGVATQAPNEKVLVVGLAKEPRQFGESLK